MVYIAVEQVWPLGQLSELVKAPALVQVKEPYSEQLWATEWERLLEPVKELEWAPVMEP